MIMKCESCFHKKVCVHYQDYKTEAYAYMGVSFSPDKCEDYINSDNIMVVKIGKWIRDSFIEGMFAKSHCSICGYETYKRSEVEVCPCCSSKMTGIIQK